MMTILQALDGPLQALERTQLLRDGFGVALHRAGVVLHNGAELPGERQLLLGHLNQTGFTIAPVAAIVEEHHPGEHASDAERGKPLNFSERRHSLGGNVIRVALGDGGEQPVGVVVERLADDVHRDDAVGLAYGGF